MARTRSSEPAGDAGVVQNSEENHHADQVGDCQVQTGKIAKLPLGQGAFAIGAAWTMSAASDNKDAAWTFLSWLQSTEGGQRIYTASTEILPALMSTAQSDVFLGAEEPPANREAFIIEAENAKAGRILLIPEWNELNGSIITPAMQQIWVGDAEPAEALPALCEQIEAFLQDNGYPQ
jgi:multiple sugar transport system substrate-binding protein